MTRWQNYLRLLIPERYPVWSIAIYNGTSPFNLGSYPVLFDGVALTADDLGDVSAWGVADPFMVRVRDEWFLFFEIENRDSGNGEIGLATSADGANWCFQGVVLAEPFHLSYPHVFVHEGSYYMVPESSAVGAVRLYRAEAFPFQWRLVDTLIEGDLADATPFFHDGLWWMLAQRGFHASDELVLYFADDLRGPWQPHPCNPIHAGNRTISRPAGRMLNYEGALYRFAQDGTKNYGRKVHAILVEELTTITYRERPLRQAPILDASGQGWNATGMHHIDVHEVAPGQWLACVDGRCSAWRLPLWERIRVRYRRWRG